MARESLQSSQDMVSGENRAQPCRKNRRITRRLGARRPRCCWSAARSGDRDAVCHSSIPYHTIKIPNNRPHGQGPLSFIPDGEIGVSWRVEMVSKHQSQSNLKPFRTPIQSILPASRAVCNYNADSPTISRHWPRDRQTASAMRQPMPYCNRRVRGGLEGEDAAERVCASVDRTGPT